MPLKGTFSRSRFGADSLYTVANIRRSVRLKAAACCVR